jgi:5-methyltetrahydrofolate--homocysteine methyltransferase
MRLNEYLETREVIVGDGAMGTRLLDRGLEPDECPELWNVERADDIAEVLRSYLEAGSDYVTTNTFGASPLALSRHGLEGKTEELCRSGVELARTVAGDTRLVLGDVGPCGRMLAPLGTTSPSEARESFARQATALAQAGADAILCETFESAEELRAALEGAAEACDLPLIASMKFQPESSGRYRSMMGEGPEHLVETAEETGCAVVGTNCGQGIETMPALVSHIASLTDLPVLVQPNAGVPELVEGKTVYQEDAAVFSRHIPRLYEAGARIIGGCCGTEAEHVRVIRDYVDSLEPECD